MGRSSSKGKGVKNKYSDRDESRPQLPGSTPPPTQDAVHNQGDREHILARVSTGRVHACNVVWGVFFPYAFKIQSNKEIVILTVE